MEGMVEAVVMAPFAKSLVNGIWDIRKAELVTSVAAQLACYYRLYGVLYM